MRANVYECPGAIHKSIDEVKANVLDMILGPGTTPPAEYRSGFQLDPAGTIRDHSNRLEGNTTPDHFGYHEVHLRPKNWRDNSRLRRMPFKVSV